MHSDHPTFEDHLSRLDSIKRKAVQIMECDAPQTFGVHGDWGAGKTSFLRQIRYHLDSTKLECAGTPADGLAGGLFEGQVVTIWFDAWRYQHESAPVIALLQEMRRQFGALAKLKNEAAKLTDVVIRSMLNSIDDVAKLLKVEAVPINPKRIQELGEQWEKEHLESRLGVDTVQSFLQEAIKTVLKNLLPAADGAGRVVVFIDDLDRCNPDAAFRLLEGLKVYLGLSNCVFVIGMNQQLVVDAIANAMPKELAPQDGKLKESAIRVRAEAYLEKLCMNIERLTPPFDTRHLLCKWVAGVDLDGIVRDALTDEEGGAIRCLPPNPRRVKALSNLLMLWWPRVESLEGELARNMRGLLIVAYVYQFHSELFQRWQFTPSFYSHIVSWAVNVWTKTDWPSYFAGLKLPELSEAAQDGEAVPKVRGVTNFPDPYSPDMFWIAPLIRKAGLTELEIQRVMSAICTPPAAL